MLVTIMRGLPGSGKSTRANELAKRNAAVICSADEFFVKGGVYRFDAKKLGSAHAYCYAKADDALYEGKSVIIDNTNVRPSEYAQYVALAIRYGATVEFERIFDAGLNDEQLAARNAHGVPVESIARMRERWKD